MSENNNNKTWATFWSENKPMAWFIIIVLVFSLGYFLYNKWTIQVGDTIIQPPTEAKEQVPTPSDEISKNDVPGKQIRTSAILETESKTVEVREDSERHGLSLSGNIIQEDGEPAINAKITCINCLASNSPVFSDQAGRFKINYSIKCEDSEYPTKVVELTIFHQNKTYSASQSISQNSVTIPLQ